MITISDLRLDWHEKTNYLDQYLEEIDAQEFYKFLFPEGCFQEKGLRNDGRGNGFLVYKNDKGKIRRKMVFEGLSEIQEIVEASETVYISPISYYGKSNKLVNARYAYALVFDIDHVSPTNLKNIIHQATVIQHIPTPTAIVNSGKGVHLYYIFQEPIPLFTANQLLLKELKKRLIDKLWNFATSSSNEKEIQGISQAYRVVGSHSKLGADYPVKGYWVGRGERITIEYLNEFLLLDSGEDRRLDIADFRRSGTIPLEKAKEKYPEWYKYRVVEKRERRYWTCHEGLYEWWKKKILTDIKVGHRYHSIVALVAFAEKCEIDEDIVREDAYGLIDFLNSKTIEADNPFTSDDVESALKNYMERKPDGKTSHTYTREYISNMTGVHIQPNKRNGRNRKEHLRRARAVQEIDYPEGTWRNKEGRPNMEHIVKDYVKDHPGASVTEIARNLEISRPTVYKYLKG